MHQPPITRSGGQILAAALAASGVDTVFCVPGESYLPVLDGLYDQREAIRLISCRQEGGAAYMAEAYGKLTGRPGVCMVTRGPGASNAAIGVHTARQDSTPMILLVGQVARGQIEREAFQEVDYRQMFGPLAKWVAQIDQAERIPEFISRACHTATSGRPGPVVLALPEDMLRDGAAVADAGGYRPIQAAPLAEDMAALRRLLAAAARPLVLVGGGGWTAQAAADLTACAEASGVPLACGFRRQDIIDNGHSCYVGHVGLGIDPALAERVRRADLIIAVGPRLGETTTGGYSLLTVPVPRQTLVHVHADTEELGRVYRPTLAINAGMPAFAAAARALPALDGAAWAGWREAARADYLATLEIRPRPGAGVDLGAVMAHLRATLPDDTIVCNGAGNYTLWVHRYWQWRRPRTQLAPTSGAMGYGLPAALAAKAVHPDRTVLAFAGDGCFLMNGQELATATQYNLDPIVILVDNGMYGTIRAHQERRFPGRVIGTGLHNPDFAALAQAYGAHGETVTRSEDFPAAFARARAAGRCAVLCLKVDPDAITPTGSLAALRQTALGQQEKP